MSDIDAGFGQSVPPPPRPVEYADRDPRTWWISVLGGIALVAVGLWLLTNLYESVTVLAWLVGLSLILAGVVDLLAPQGEQRVGAVSWIASGLLVAAGIVVLVWPDITLWALAVMAGVGLVFAGAAQAVLALAVRDRADMPLRLALAGLTIALGVMVIVWPDATLVVLAVLLGLRAIGSGLISIGIGWQLHRQRA